MSGRANAFENLADVPVFNVKPKTEKPVARENGVQDPVPINGVTEPIAIAVVVAICVTS
jgi:hypothetical protein